MALPIGNPPPQQETSTEDLLRQQLQQLQQENNKLRFQQEDDRRTYEQKISRLNEDVSMIRNHVNQAQLGHGSSNSGGLPRDGWEDAYGLRVENDQEAVPLDPQSIDKLVQKRIQEQQQAAREAEQAKRSQAEQDSAWVASRLQAEEPDLVGNQLHLIKFHQAWHGSFQMNPNLDARTRYDQVMAFTKNQIQTEQQLMNQYYQQQQQAQQENPPPFDPLRHGPHTHHSPSPTGHPMDSRYGSRRPTDGRPSSPEQYYQQQNMPYPNANGGGNQFQTRHTPQQQAPAPTVQNRIDQSYASRTQARNMRLRTNSSTPPQ